MKQGCPRCRKFAVLVAESVGLFSAQGKKEKEGKKNVCVFCCFSFLPSLWAVIEKGGGSKQQTVRRFVAVLNSLYLTVIKRRAPILGRNDRKVSLTCTRRISYPTLFAFLCAFFLPPGLETRGALAVAEHRGFDVSFGSRWKNRHTWRVSRMYTRYRPIS